MELLDRSALVASAHLVPLTVKPGSENTGQIDQKTVAPTPKVEQMNWDTKYSFGVRSARGQGRLTGCPSMTCSSSSPTRPTPDLSLGLDRAAGRRGDSVLVVREEVFLRFRRRDIPLGEVKERREVLKLLDERGCDVVPLGALEHR